MNRIVMHIDVNNAFLSWTAVELLKSGYPIDIRNIPAIIGGDETKRKGIVLAKSPVAKKMGVKTADTIYSVRQKYKDIKIYSSNYKLYEQKSKELFSIIKEYTPDIEKASIDECYIEYTNIKKIYGNEIDFAYNLKNRIKKQLGFTVNIGIANNKLCAKMASDFEKPDKVHTLYMNEVKKKMYPLPIEDLFTVGKSTSKKLRFMGINTIGDLANCDPNSLKSILKNTSKRYVELARGIDNSPVNSNDFVPKGISNEITLDHDIFNITDIYKPLSYLSAKVAKRLRQERKYAKVICVILKDNKFKRYSHQKKIVNPVNSYSEIYSYAKKILSELYNGEKIRLIGIRLDNLVSVKNHQTSFFEDNKSNNDLEVIIDKINDKYGYDVIKRASFLEKK